MPKSRKARRREERAKKKLSRSKKRSTENSATQNTSKELPIDDNPKKRRTNLKQPEKKAGHRKKPKKDDPYAHLDPEVAAAMLRDDEEIASLEAKLGLSSQKAKVKLHKEYGKLEGFGDDFGSFLDDIDGMMMRVTQESPDEELKNKSTEMVGLLSDSDMENPISDSDEEEIVVPMKAPALDHLDDEESAFENELESERIVDQIRENKIADKNEDSEQESEDDVSDEGAEEEPDHDVIHTYRPSKGEDLYGNKIHLSENAKENTKYVPPHLRRKQQELNEIEDADRKESLRAIQRSLNNTLNRLSEDTLVPVSQSIAELYTSHPRSDVNELIWKNARNACMPQSIVMSTLIPVYVAALIGVHIQKGDSAQLGEYLMEVSITELWNELESARSLAKAGDHNVNSEDEIESESYSKTTANLILVLCYLYNYGIVHCSLLYDVVRDLIQSFTEVDAELLLLILSHSGRALRSDDPTALKDIVLEVQKRSVEVNSSSSRVDYMVSAMMDLKNNKRRKQDNSYSEKTTKLRKALGQIKSNVLAGKNGARTSDSSLRITLQDILDSKTKGRWWKVGASWIGNQYKLCDEGSEKVEMETKQACNKANGSDEGKNKEDHRLLRLASKYRMNTDIRRSIFCIITGCEDCEDCFEKLVRAGMLKNRTQRDTVRVLMECCGNEKSYNKFYSHLAQRICEYQPQCKFSFQLAFWDTFKLFDELKVRKAASLAKLLFHLVAVHHLLKLNVLKPIDMSSPEELPEAALIFLTLFLTNILDHFDDPSDVARLFERDMSQSGNRSREPSDDAAEDINHMDESEALRANLTVFFMQTLKASPKYKRGSKFRTNLKVAVKACDTDNFF